MDKQHRSFWFSPNGIASLGLIGAVSYFLIVEHRQHLYEWLPFMIIALCPLMHIFMHRGHGGLEEHDHKESLQDSDELKDAYQRGIEEGKKHSNTTSRLGE